MNEHDLYRVMKDIDRKYTDELYRYTADLVTTKRRRETMKQKVKNKASAAQFLPWKIGIGAAVVACAAIAIIIGGGIISLDNQMQVSSNVGASMSEQIVESTADKIHIAVVTDQTLPENYTEEQEISAEHTTHTTVSSRNITKTAQIEELEEPQNEQNSAEDTTISMMIPENTDTESSEIIGDFDLDGRITPADYAWADLILYAELENIIDELPLNEEQMRQCELIPNDTTMSPLGEEEYKAIQNAGKLCWWGITNALDFRAYLDNQEYYNKLLHEYIPPELHPQSDDDNFTVLVRKIQRYTADSCMKRYGNQGWWSTANFEGFPIASLDEILVELEAAKDWKVGYYS